MIFDPHQNLALATVVIAPSPSLSGTTLIVNSGALLPNPAGIGYNCTVYPAGVTPTAANAEIVRVTAIVGDILTITRAQEGTTAKAIASGWSIANTITVKVITDIENAISSGGSGILSVSAGTLAITNSEVIFSNSNGVSFGASSNIITASFSGGGGGGAAISAGGNSQNTGTVQFSNSNGVTFGLSNNGVMTASHDGITSQSVQPVAASASNGSFAFSTLAFSDANGVTFGTSAGGIITASVGTAAAGNSVNFSAGTESANLGSIVFSNSNGVSFGLDGSSITASHNGLTSQSNQAASASNGSFVFQTLAFSNANNVTFGTSAGGIITASVSPGAGSINFSAGTQSADLASIVFSNSNGVSFGLSNGTITASASGGAGGGGSLVSFAPFPLVSTGSESIQIPDVYLAGFCLPVAINNSYLRFMVSMVTSSSNLATIASASATANGGVVGTAEAWLYTYGSGASSDSLQLVTQSSIGMTLRNEISISNSSQASYTQAVTYPLFGQTQLLSTQYSLSSSVYGFSTTLFSGFTGQKFMDVPLATSLSAGNYWVGFRFSYQSTTDGALTQISRAQVWPRTVFLCNQPDYRAMFFGQTESSPGYFGAGSWTAAAGGTTDSINTSNVTLLGSNRRIYFELHT